MSEAGFKSNKEMATVVLKQPPVSGGAGTSYGTTSSDRFGILGKPLNNYQHEIFDCGNCEHCFLSFFCICIANSLIARKLNIFLCYPRCFGVLPMAVQFRALVGIEEDFCLEGCEASLCPCCFTNRLLTEMELRGFDLRKNHDENSPDSDDPKNQSMAFARS